MSGKKTFDFIKSYGIITLGAFLSALSLNLFLVPHNVVAGGVTGIATLLFNFVQLPMGVTILALNLPLFLLGIRFLGGGFGAKTFYGTVMLSVLVEVTHSVPGVTGDPILASLAGGAMMGFGLGMVFLSGATTGGTDVAARLLHKAAPAVDVGQWICIIDFIIILGVGVLFKNYELSLYGLLALVLNSFIIDLMLEGANDAELVYILSEKHRQIAERVLSELSRGVTGLHATGMYRGTETTMLMCVVKKFELGRLRRIVSEIDKKAFLIHSRARKVSGEGFKIYPQ